MAYTTLKTREVASISVQQYLWTRPDTYYWTFTIHEAVTDKDVALSRAKPLFDLIRRRQELRQYADKPTQWYGGSYLAFWELQQRGSWHLHLLTGCRFDVNWLRPWLVERGWGQQMRVEWVHVSHAAPITKYGCPLGVANVGNGGARLARYLTKYLTKSLDEVPGKKAFNGSREARAGTTGFCWMPGVNPAAYFFYYGRELFVQLYGRQPRLWGWNTELQHVMRLGYEAVEWWIRDPWTDPP
jgi:hypothetical protein